ncbi:hypothetical protein AGMMS49936_06760 [Endomicrobiia bacterium]|nr:hypothetical protein AGMMS49936_06760 [Endomicrobiia bacterium]
MKSGSLYITIIIDRNNNFSNNYVVANVNEKNDVVDDKMLGPLSFTRATTKADRGCFEWNIDLGSDKFKSDATNSNFGSSNLESQEVAHNTTTIMVPADDFTDDPTSQVIDVITRDCPFLNKQSNLRTQLLQVYTNLDNDIENFVTVSTTLYRIKRSTNEEQVAQHYIDVLTSPNILKQRIYTNFFYICKEIYNNKEILFDIIENAHIIINMNANKEIIDQCMQDFTQLLHAYRFYADDGIEDDIINFHNEFKSLRSDNARITYLREEAKAMLR